MGFVKDVGKNSSDSHQASPAYVVTFIRWSNRDTFNYNSKKNVTATDGLGTRAPLVVVNDAISINLTNTKAGITPTCTVQLKGGDLNYATAIHPGDFMLVNMVNWPQDAMRIRGNALGRKPVNRIGDGFKGVFKIQSIVKDLVVDPGSGTKTLMYTVTAAGFTELNNNILYNPAIQAAFSKEGTNIYQFLIGKFYQDKLKTIVDIQIIVRDLFTILIGKSRRDKSIKVPNFGNGHYKVPLLLGQLLGKPGSKYANEIFNYIIGIWKSVSVENPNQQNISKGFNPGIKTIDKKTKNKETDFGNHYNTGSSIQGNKLILVENWNGSTAWSIIKQNINETMNEIYTTYRVSPDTPFVQPTIVVRQKPFTTEHFDATNSTQRKVTRFMQLPRWRIAPNLLLSQQTSKNEAARYNFVQVYTRRTAATAPMDMAQQIVMGNFVTDDADIERNGLRPAILRSNFDFPVGENSVLRQGTKVLRAKDWAKVASDWLIDGHLKESGVFTFQGIQDPISVGDNLEFDNIVYHIESINHKMQIKASDGKIVFKTIVQVSYGMDLRSSKSGPVYSNMEHTDAYTERIEDWDNERILPGIGDSQDLPSRQLGEEVTETRQGSFTPRELRKNKEKKNQTSKETESLKDDGGGGPTRKKT